jgi:hypothetical protein
LPAVSSFASALTFAWRRTAKPFGSVAAAHSPRSQRDVLKDDRCAKCRMRSLNSRGLSSRSVGSCGLKRAAEGARGGRKSLQRALAKRLQETGGRRGDGVEENRFSSAEQVPVIAQFP